MPRRNNLLKFSPYQQPKSCDSKRKYASEHEAIKTAEYQMLLNPGLELSVYKCDLCQKWHLTKSQP